MVKNNAHYANSELAMNPDNPAWHSMIEPSMDVEAAGDIDWDDSADFIVVGFGGAGATAALRARENGLDVIALDCADGGGATLASGGVVYAGGGTAIQSANGEQDSSENMFNYLKLETQGVIDDATLRRFCDQSAGNLDWLMSHGVQFSGPVWKEKTSYPNVDYFLYHSDNSLLPQYARHAAPAARGHRGVIRKGRSAVNLGGSIYNPLRKQCLELGVQLHTKTEVRQLICDKKGAVLGVRALKLPYGTDAYHEHQKCLARGKLLANFYPFFLPGARLVHGWAGRYFARAAEIERAERRWLNFRAYQGVCLSAGGFVFNRAMVKHHCPAFKSGMPLGTPADNGAGIRLGESVGGKTSHMDRATAWRFINPPRAWSQGIMVNGRGARFVNESTYGATIGDAMVNKADGKAWLLLDDALVKEAWRQIWPTKVLPFQWQLGALNMLFAKRKLHSVEALCEHYGFDQTVLLETLKDLSDAVLSGESDNFGKPSSELRELNLPFHVIDVSLGARLLPCTVLTMGGLVVNEETGQVRDDAGREIVGLYAAGRTAVGIPSWLYMSGLSIADCVFSGLRAADHVAEQNLTKQAS